MTRSIRSRLLITLLALATGASLLAGWFAYRQVIEENERIFDYQLRQMALSLRNQVGLAQRIEVPSEQGDEDYIVQIWDVFGRSVVYFSRPGLPVISRPNAGYANFEFEGEPWRVYGLETVDGVIQVAQPQRIQRAIARASAIRVAIPVLLLVPILGAAIVLVVQGGLRPLQRVADEVKRREVNSLTPVETDKLPDEVLPLARELNRLLSRVDSALANQRAFIADAAHELRSPLTAVRLQLQLLDRATDAAAASEARARLREAIDRAAHMIEQLLTLARSEPRDVTGDLKPVPLETPAAEAISDSHALAQSRHIELELHAEPNVWIRGDPGALRTLVRNLVDNAVRYTPEHGKVEVRIGFGARADAARPGGSPASSSSSSSAVVASTARSAASVVSAGSAASGATLEVLDSGPGIPEADRARAFDRFYRRAAAPEGGSGLGLAIVKAIAERHGAQIGLDRASLGGLRVTVTFPPPL